jgi:hypothetical protein
MELTNTQKTLFWIFGGLILILLVVFFVKLYKEKQAKEAKKQADEKNEALARESAKMLPPEPSKEALENIQKSIQELSDKQTESQMMYNDSFPLRYGSVGKRVEQLQMFIFRKWGWQGKIDGKWGDQTQAGVEKWLKTKELSEVAYNAYNLSAIKTNIFK